MRNRNRIIIYFIIIALFGAGIFFIADYHANPRNTNTQNTNSAIINNTPQNSNVTANTNSMNLNINTNAPANTNANTNSISSLTGDFSEINRGNTSKSQIILTFDAGSSNISIEQVLNVLADRKIKATFFLTGKWALAYSGDAKKIAAAGHEIFNHTYDHPHLKQISDAAIIEEFARTETIIKDLTGLTTKPFFRPPYGERNGHILEIAQKQGYRSVFWTVDALDWEESQGMTASQVKERIASRLEPGAIILMHVGDNITGQVLSEVIDNIIDKGYTPVSLSAGL